MNFILYFYISLYCVVCTGTYLQSKAQYDHLIVLSHGLMGYPSDLNYLANLLRNAGCIVLQSESNKFDKTLSGIPIASSRLIEEIRDIHQKNPQLQRISFVGNSLGGLFVRYTIAMLHNESDNTIDGLLPYKFMSIATPHLGVRDYTFLDEYGLKIPYFAKSLFSNTLLNSGKELFLSDIDTSLIRNRNKGNDRNKKNREDDLSTTLLYIMATTNRFLHPLRQFKERRLYANLRNDFVVPLGTAAFLIPKDVDSLRNKYHKVNGIVVILRIKQNNSQVTYLDEKSKDSYIYSMIKSLDNCGWEKVLVNFDLTFGLFPFAHNKICALAPGSRYPSIVTDKLLRFNEGKYVMENATQWLIA